MIALYKSIIYNYLRVVDLFDKLINEVGESLSL